ncbi:MAG: polysaccharide biosynthesis protein [Acidimicrobiales bacterium]|nr:polysaccharide biosynthesis protein [Acidimicrobiales bacterium]
MNIEARPYRRRLLQNVVAAGAGNVWAMLVAVVSLPLLLHALGPTAFGSWVLIQTFSAVNGWFSLGDVGVGAAATYFVGLGLGAEDEAGQYRSAGTAVWIFIALGIVSGAVLALCGPVVLPHVFSTPASLRGAVRAAIQWFGIQILFDTVTEGCESVLEGCQRVDLSRAADALRRTLVAIGTVFVASAGGGLRDVALVSAAASGVGMLFAVILLTRQVPGAWRSARVAEVRRLLAYGWRVAALDANGVLHRTMDRLLVGSFIGPAAVTVLEVAMQVMNTVAAVLSSASYAVLSSAALLAGRRDRHAMARLLDEGTRLTLLVTWPVAAGAAMLAGPIVHVWVGPRYHGAAGLAAVAIAYIALAAPLQVGSNLLRGTGRVNDVLRPAMAAVTLNLVASFLLVQAVGTVGVLEGSLVGLVILLPMLTRSFLDVAGLSLREFLLHSVGPALVPLPFLCAAVGLVLASPLGPLQTLLVGTGVGGLVYVAAMLLTVLPPAKLRDVLSLGGGGRSAPKEVS